MKKIVIVTNMMSFYRLDLFNELSKNTNYKFHIIFSAEKENNNRVWEINKDKLVFDYTILKSKSIIKKGKGIKETRIINIPKDVFKTLKKINPDIIIGSEYNPTVIKAFFYCKLNHKKYISWSDGTLNSERFISFPQKIIRKFICNYSDYFIASSTETKQAQIKYGANKNKISISLLTIDTESFISNLSRVEKKNSEIPHILYCGYLMKLKGINFLIESLKNVKSDFIFDIVGNGEDEENLKRLVKNNSLEKKVNFLGYKNREEIIFYYKNSDIFIFPSLNDAFGLVLVEALASGLPIISSIYAGSSKDAIDEGVNGFIIDPQNIKIFSEKIEFLLSNKLLRISMGEKSFQKSKIFLLFEVVKGFYEVIDKC